MFKKSLILAIFVSIVAGTILPITAAQAAPSGILTGWCVNTGNQPYVFLEWGSHPSANSNGLQKRDSYPSNPQQDWGWLPTNGDQRAYVDYNVARGVAYTYRVKYRPELPSNEVTVTCPFTATPTPTPTVTPVPVLPLYCSPTFSFANSGDWVRFDAVGGNGAYTWTIPGGNPGAGVGSPLLVRFFNYSGIVQSHWVTVFSGGRSMSCEVRVQPQTFISPTPTPTVTPVPANLMLTLTGRNVTKGQSGEYVVLSARGGDTLDLVIRVRNTANHPGFAALTNVVISDFLPSGFTTISGSTTINGFVTADGITSTGINIGSLAPQQEVAVKFSVRVEHVAIPPFGEVVTNTTAQARADGVMLRTAQLPITLGKKGSITTAVGIPTGPVDSVFLAMLAASVAAAGYAAYAFSVRGQRRLALAEIAATRGAQPNFVR